MKARIDLGNVLILDGAVGTALQGMGVPMNNTAWAAVALKDYPTTTQRMHELYIEAGADVITTNTFSSARHNLEPLGLGDMTFELNARAVMLAQTARTRAAHGRQIWIGGSISSFGIMVGREHGPERYQYTQPRSVVTAEYAQRCLEEQAELLAGQGIDFFLTECLNENEHRRWIVNACRRTSLPIWVGFAVRLVEGKVYLGQNLKIEFREALDEVLADDIAGVSIFHSSVGAIGPALNVLKDKWHGAIAVYPDSERSDYIATSRNLDTPNKVSERELADHARGWAKEGVQLFGGCCGFEFSYIKHLAAELNRASN